jgi:hypothetical protein
MDAQKLIESYTNDVARRLPRKLRNEVGLELRALLTDKVNALASDTGREPNADTALAVLREFGRPEVVAARYAPRGFNVIEPEHAPAFVKLSLACVALQWAVTLPRVATSAVSFDEWWLGWGAGALWWVGLLVVWFALAGWIQRRSPVDPHSFVRPWTHFIFWIPVARDWQPALPNAEELPYASAKVLVPLSAVLMVLFVSPAWFIGRLGVDGSWALYDAGFRRWLLAPLFALMVVRLVLFTLAAVDKQRRARTEAIRLALLAAFVVLLVWTLFRWDIFALTFTDLAFKIWLSIFTLVNGLNAVAWLRRLITRVHVPKTLTQR